MTEWWTYAPADLLMFSPRVYFRLLELHNAALWPAQLLTLVLGLAMVVIAIRAPPWAGRAIAGVLGVLWIWVAWSFLWERYATINWAAAYVAPVFAAQGLGLIWLGVVRQRLELVSHRGLAWWSAAALAAAAVMLYPLLAPLMGRPWSAAEAFGIFPDPTAVATLAALALMRRSLPLMIIPALWCALAAETLWLLEVGRQGLD
jgi:hypothetical protein